MRGAGALLGLALIAGAALVPSARLEARDEPLLIALSTQLIEIDSSFAGTSILLFGATDEPGDIVVSVRGPEMPMVVRRKRRSAGIWVNQDSVAFRNVPQYYATAASRPLEEIASQALLEHEQIGIDHLLLEAIWIRTPDDTDDFRTALSRNRKREALYQSEVGSVEFIDEGLFRTQLTFPANVPTGYYQAKVFLIRDGKVSASRSTALRIEKGGFSADISTFARSDAAIYGVIAIVLALVAGWAGSFAFRKT
jgi:uncharacterized protein (TIGR02186 family)